MNEAQQAIAAVLAAHLMTPYARCTCGFNLADYDDAPSWSEHVAAEIDTALGGLRRITDTGLLEGGFLVHKWAGILDHDPAAMPKTYAKWITGWTEAR